MVVGRFFGGLFGLVLGFFGLPVVVEREVRKLVTDRLVHGIFGQAAYHRRDIGNMLHHWGGLRSRIYRISKCRGGGQAHDFQIKSLEPQVIESEAFSRTSRPGGTITYVRTSRANTIRLVVVVVVVVVVAGCA